MIKDYRILFSLSLFSSPISRSPLHGDLLLLYSLLKLIGTLHLFTIRTFTWVPVPSDIHLIFLWVALANVTLFAYLLHINAAGKVASLHLMRQLWLPPRRLTFSSFFLLCEAYPTTYISLGWFFTVDRAHIGPIFGVSEETFLLGRLLNKLGLTGLGWKSFGPLFPFCQGWTPCGAQGPLLTCEFYPHKLYIENALYFNVLPFSVWLMCSRIAMAAKVSRHMFQRQQTLRFAI